MFRFSSQRDPGEINADNPEMLDIGRSVISIDKFLRSTVKQFQDYLTFFSSWLFSHLVEYYIFKSSPFCFCDMTDIMLGRVYTLILWCFILLFIHEMSIAKYIACTAICFIAANDHDFALSKSLNVYHTERGCM